MQRSAKVDAPGYVNAAVSSGRSGKQQQEQNSQNLEHQLLPISEYFRPFLALIQTHYNDRLKDGPRVARMMRESHVEVVSISRKEVHRVWGPPFS